MVKPYKGQFNWVVDLQILHGEFIFYGTNYQHWLVTIRSLIDNFQSFTLPSCSVRASWAAVYTNVISQFGQLMWFFKMTISKLILDGCTLQRLSQPSKNISLGLWIWILGSLFLPRNPLICFYILDQIV